MHERPVETVLGRLDGVRRSGRGWTARCPAHEDWHASLSISEGDDGRALLFCHAACRAENVVRALGLELRDLFPPKDNTGIPQTRLRNRPRSRRAVIPRSVAKILIESSEFALTWETAKLLAPLEPRQQHVDVLRSWDYLVARDVDIPALMRLASIVRGVAMFKFCWAKSARDPAAVARAIDRLIEEIS